MWGGLVNKELTCLIIYSLITFLFSVCTTYILVAASEGSCWEAHCTVATSREFSLVSPDGPGIFSPVLPNPSSMEILAFPHNHKCSRSEVNLGLHRPSPAYPKPSCSLPPLLSTLLSPGSHSTYLQAPDSTSHFLNHVHLRGHTQPFLCPVPPRSDGLWKLWTHRGRDRISHSQQHRERTCTWGWPWVHSPCVL